MFLAADAFYPTNDQDQAYTKRMQCYYISGNKRIFSFFKKGIELFLILKKKILNLLNEKPAECTIKLKKCINRTKLSVFSQRYVPIRCNSDRYRRCFLSTANTICNTSLNTLK